MIVHIALSRAVVQLLSYYSTVRFTPQVYLCASYNSHN